MRFAKLLLTVAAFTMIGVGVIHAAEDEGVPLIADGRVNDWQIDAPAAVYCVFTENTDDTSTFERIEVWDLNNTKVVEASAAQTNAAQGAETLASANGYTLSQLADDSFQLSAPNGYVFEWERGDAGC
jgi:hypothetical protein